MNSPSTPWRLRRLTIVLFLLLTAALPGRVTAALQTPSYQEDFESGQAEGWQLEPGWSVMMDGTNHVLSGQGHTWARSNQSFDGDMRLSFRVNLLQGRIHLVTRLSGASRYFIGFDTKGSDLNKQYFPDEFHNGLAGLDSAHSLNRWYQIAIAFQGSRIEFLVDGVRQWSYTDPQPLAGGSFAFETLDGSQAYVDDILVETGAGPAPTVTHAPAGVATTVKASPTTPTNSTWVRTGGPLGGLGYDIRMRPDNPDVMFVTDSWAGVFKSQNGGLEWFPSSTGITNRTGPTGDAIPVFSLTIDPNNPEIVWLGTQHRRGVYKSTNGGQTWTKMVNGILEDEGISVRGIAVDPHDSNVVYVAAELSSWVWNHGQPRNGREFDMTAGVVYKSTNGGQSWKAVWRGDNLARYVWIDPRDSRVIYVSTGIFDREAANSDPGQGKPGGEGVLKSIDGGATWMRVNNGLGNLYVGSLFMHPTNPDILLAGTGNNQYQSEAGVYLSLDGGNNWSNTLPSDSAITSVEIAQSNTNIAYAGSRSAVYRSEDGGRTWHQVAGGSIPWGSPGVQTGFPIDFQVDPRNPDRLFANAYGGGAFLSEDGGRTWKVESKGYTGAQVRSIAVDPTAPGRLVTAARSGVFASANGGSDWAGVNPANFDSIEWNAVAIDPADPQHFIAGLNVHGWLANSLDGGSTWQTVEGPHENRIGWRAIAFAPSNPGVVYAGSAGYYSAGTFDPSQPGIGIYVSHNHGNSWTPANDSQTFNAHVTSLAVDPSEPQVVFAATANHGLVKTEDSGKNWVTLKGGWSVKTMILSVAVSPVNPKVVVAGTNQAGLWLSTDGGQTWKYTGYGLNPEASIADIVFDPADPSKQLYLADHFGGVYRSTDGGKSWRTLNNGLLNRDINSLAFSSDGLHLYAASEGAGVFRLDLNGAPPPALAQIPTQARNPTTESIQVTPYVYQEATTTSTPGKKPLFNLPCGSTAVLSLALIVSLYAGRRRRMH